MGSIKGGAYRSADSVSGTLTRAWNYQFRGSEVQVGGGWGRDGSVAGPWWDRGGVRVVYGASVRVYSGGWRADWRMAVRLAGRLERAEHYGK